MSPGEDDGIDSGASIPNGENQLGDYVSQGRGATYVPHTHLPPPFLPPYTYHKHTSINRTQ